jgi:hypothetical protein
MTLALLVAVLATASLPLILVRLHRSTRTVVYTGAAQPITQGLEDLGQRTNTRYCWFKVNDELYLAELAPDVYAKIPLQSEPADVTIVKYLGKPQVESVQFRGDQQRHPVATPGNQGMYVGLTYFMSALAAIFAAVQLPEIASAAFYSAALFFALTGFSLTMLQAPNARISEMSVLVAGRKLGSGLIPLAVTFAIALALTFACFTWISVFTFFPGIHAAFAVGSFAALLLKSRQATQQSG